MVNDEPDLIKVSVIQASLRRYDKEQNVERCARMIEEEAAAHSPHLICIPNYFFQRGLEEIPGPSTLALSSIAIRRDVYIIGGMGESSSDGKGYNSGFLISPDGNVRLLQRKIHMISMEKEKLNGGSIITPLDTPLGRLGCVLCNDIFYPEAARTLALQGAEIIVSPSIIGGIGTRGLEIAAKARAIENQVFVVSANGIPYEAAREHPELEMGKSGIYSPFLDKVDLALAGEEEGAIRAILDMEELRELKATLELSAKNHGQLAMGKGFNMLKSRRPEVYGLE